MSIQFKDNNFEVWVQIYGGRNLESFKHIVTHYLIFRKNRHDRRVNKEALYELTVDNHNFTEDQFFEYLEQMSSVFEPTKFRLGTIQLKCHSSIKKISKEGSSEMISTEPHNPNELDKPNKSNELDECNESIMNPSDEGPITSQSEIAQVYYIEKDSSNNKEQLSNEFELDEEEHFELH